MSHRVLRNDVKKTNLNQYYSTMALTRPVLQVHRPKVLMNWNDPPSLRVAASSFIKLKMALKSRVALERSDPVREANVRE